MGTLEATKTDEKTAATTGTRDALSVTDHRTGKTYELPIKNGTIRAMDLRQIKTGADDFGLMAYDPAFLNTASCTSRITYIDGDKGTARIVVGGLAADCVVLRLFGRQRGESDHQPRRSEYDQRAEACHHPAWARSARSDDGGERRSRATPYTVCAGCSRMNWRNGRS